MYIIILILGTGIHKKKKMYVIYSSHKSELYDCIEQFAFFAHIPASLFHYEKPQLMVPVQLCHGPTIGKKKRIIQKVNRALCLHSKRSSLVQI